LPFSIWIKYVNCSSLVARACMVCRQVCTDAFVLIAAMPTDKKGIRDLKNL
jgi:hypothetical protein